MIPRLRPYFEFSDVRAALFASKDACMEFEQQSARELGFKHTLLLSLGRTALYLYLKALKAEGKKVVLAVYNCRVVASTIMFAGAIPSYVDAQSEGYNASADDIIAAVDDSTAAIVMTSMYGYPFSREDIYKIKQHCPHVPLIGDCALALFSRSEDYYFADEMDVCFYAFGIGKQLSIVEGGLLATNSSELLVRMSEARRAILQEPSAEFRLKQWLLFLGSTVMFHKQTYGLLYYLSEETSLLSSFKGSDIAVTELMPPDWKFLPCPFQGGIGLNQLNKFKQNREQRARIVDKYFEELSGHQSERFRLPPYFKYLSHFPVLSTERDELEVHLLRNGAHVTNVFRELPWDLPLVQDGCSGDYPNARELRDQCTLLPLYPQLDDSSLKAVVSAVKKWVRA